MNPEYLTACEPRIFNCLSTQEYLTVCVPRTHKLLFYLLQQSQMISITMRTVWGITWGGAIRGMISPVTIEMDLSVKNHVSVFKQNFLYIFVLP